MNRRGKQISERLSMAESYGARENEDLAQWCTEGDEIRDTLAQAVHGDIDPAAGEEDPVRAWQATGREVERTVNERLTAFGAAVRKSGLSADEAADAVARGDLKI